MASHLHSEWPSSVFSSPREHRDATRLLKSDRGDVTHPANAGWSYGRKPHLPGVIQFERGADSFPRKYDGAKRYGRNQACRHGEHGVQRVQISCVFVSDELVGESLGRYITGYVVHHI